MIKEVIEYYNLLIGQMPYFSNIYGLAEIKTAKDVSRPVIYSGVDYENLKFNTKGTTYFRKRADVSITETTNQISCSIVYVFNIPLRLTAVTKREDFPSDDSYSADRLASGLIKELTFKNGALKQQIGAVSVTSKSSGYSTNSQDIIQSELNGLRRNDFNHEDIVVGINIDLVVTSYTNCLQHPCEYTPPSPPSSGNSIVLFDNEDMIIME